MGRKKKEGTNITIRFDVEEYDFIKSKAETEYGTLALGQVVRSIIRKYILL